MVDGAVALVGGMKDQHGQQPALLPRLGGKPKRGLAHYFEVKWPDQPGTIYMSAAKALSLALGDGVRVGQTS